jgi:acetyltransferase-like isoleucine patch superfamily enzyme
MNIFKKATRYIYTSVKLRANRVKFHYRVLGNSFYIHNEGSISLGEKVSLHSYPNGTSYRTALTTYFPEAVIEIGNNCNINGTVIHCNQLVKIGNNCMFGPGTVICDNDSHRISKDPVERRKKAVSIPIIFKDNVWIGMNCLILKGVTIGENSIVAAGSVVVNDVPPNSIAGGNPARVLKEITD